MVINDLLWRRPRHHMDVDEAHDHVHWVELFFDLVHVVTIFILGNYLSHHLGWQGFWVFTGLFLAIFYAWADSSVYNSLYISTDMPHRVVMALKIVTMMTIAAAIPDVGGEGWTYFALGYALNRALTAYLYCALYRQRGQYAGAGTGAEFFRVGRGVRTVGFFAHTGRLLGLCRRRGSNPAAVHAAARGHAPLRTLCASTRTHLGALRPFDVDLAG